MHLNIKISGIDALLNKLNPERLEEKIEEGVSRLGDKALELTKFFTPVVSGQLQSGWTENKMRLRIEVSNPVVYAWYVEVGHRRDGTHRIKKVPNGYRMVEKTVMELSNNLSNYFNLF